MKKVFSVLAILLLCFSLPVRANASTIPIVAVQPYYEKAINANSQEFYKNQNLSESYNSLTESKNTYSSNSYIALTTKTTSNDATFGSCSYNTNGIFY